MPLKIYLSVFCVSVSVLAGEMGIIRYMSVANSASFAAMIISIALLGFGVSGTIITIIRNTVERHIDLLLYLSALLFALASAYAVPLAQMIEFVPQSLQQDASQILKLGEYYLVFFVPFFFGSLFINLTFIKMKKGIGILYFFNLLGSGIGALLILLLMSFIEPQNLMMPVVVFSIIPLVLLAPAKKWHAVSAAVLAIAFIPFALGLKLEMSPYKDISYAMKFPDAKILKTVSAPTGFIQVVESSQFHFAPGLSLSCYNVETPNQLGLYIDGFSASGIARDISGKETEYIANLPFAVPFLLKTSPDVLILGAGGGNPVLFAKKLGAKSITAVEPNAPLVSLIRKSFADYSRGLFDNTKLVVSDGRSFCQKDSTRYDIVTIPAMLSSGMSFSSGAGNGENYLFTREAFRDYFARLNDGGLIAISMNLVSPPRQLLKLEAIAFEFAKREYPSDFSKRIAFLRGLDWGMIILKKGVFTDKEISLLKKTTNDLTADLSYYYGIKDTELNKNNVIEDELYYKLASAYIAGNEAQFIDNYFFNIEPPSDSKPFFEHNLKMSAVPRILGFSGGLENIPFSEWGYLVNWATLVQGIFFSFVIILIPVVALGRSFMNEKGKASVVAYFSALGLGFMLVEITVIQKLTLVIANPLYSVAVVIASLLIFSGIGARVSAVFSKNSSRGIGIAVSGITVSVILHTLLFSYFSQSFLSLGEAGRIAVAIISLAPLGFFMGMPFPLGLQVLSDRKESFLPWALAINGSVSVFAAVFTTILSMHYGFSIVMVVSIACYIMALVSFPGKFIKA